jgi:AcrR family transcriptional regulator
MAQRPRVDREEREAIVLREAGAVFAARGFHAASMDEIADRVGVSKPMVYAHFGSKEALYLAYIEEAGRDLLTAIVDAERARRPGTIEERLEAGTLAFFRFVDHHRDGWAVLFSEMAGNGGPVRREVSAIRRQIVERVQRLFEEAAGDGVDLEPFAHAFVGAGESIANWWLEHPGEDVERVARRLILAGWHGLGHALEERASSASPRG